MNLILRMGMLLVVVSVLLPASSSYSDPDSQDSILSNRTISVVMDNNYPPFSFSDETGTLQGILIDEWKLWEQKTGVKAEIHGLEWGEALRRMEQGEFDVIDTIFYNDERSKIFDFSKPYVKLEVPIFFNKNISGISGPASARGFVIGVKSGDNIISVLNKSGAYQLQEYPSYQDIIQAAHDGNIMVFSVDKPPALYYLYKLGISDQFLQTEPVYTGEFHRAVRKGKEELLQTVETGFSLISPEEKINIKRKWYGTPLINQEYLVYIEITVLIAVIVIALLLIWNHVLKNLVAQKTQQLQWEIEISNQRAEALSESEKFLNNIVENIPDMIFVKEARDFRFVRFNKAGENLLGYSREELYGHNDYDFFPKEEADFFRLKDEESLNSDQITDIAEEIINTQYRGKRFLHTKKIPILDEKGNPQYLLGISEDITEVKMAEDALMQAQKKLSFLNSIVFTEIQSKLFSLAGFINLLEGLVTDDEQNAYIKSEQRLIKDIEYLLNSTKDYQNLGQQTPKWQIASHSYLLGVSHLDISHLTSSADLNHLEIFADPLLEKVFFILADNVVKHSQTATRITCTYQEKGSDVLIVFEDDGIGIPDSEKESIFGRTGKNKYQMGLFLAKEILGITGIGIEETGIYGKGARFEIIIPKGRFRLSGS
jgi:PAS domain S-box-containing protein